MKFRPECKYGHGELYLDNKTWALSGVEVTNNPNNTFTTAWNGHAYTLKIYRCNTCGYLELFDDVVENNG